MAIEIVPKEKVKIPPSFKFFDVIYYLVIALVVISFLGYFVLDIFAKRAERRLIELETAISEKETNEIKNLELEVIAKKEKIDIFASLLAGHIKTSNFFEFLKQNCHQQVFFSKTEINSPSNQAVVSGRADNFRVLGEQMLVLEEQDLIEKVDLKMAALAREGGIEFELKLLLEPSIFLTSTPK